jgi:hypothetical protein
LDKIVQIKTKVNVSLSLTKYHAIRAYEGVKVLLHVFLTSVLNGCEWSASRTDSFIPRGKALSIRWIGGWVGNRAGLDMTKRKMPQNL